MRQTVLQRTFFQSISLENHIGKILIGSMGDIEKAKNARRGRQAFRHALSGHNIMSYRNDLRNR